MAKQQRRGRKPQIKREQPRKDSDQKRVNFDNERESKFEKDMEGRGWEKTSKCNDVRWYAKNPELLRAAASLPFSTVTGEVLDFTGQEAVPGVLQLAWSPSIGNNGGFNAINQASNAIYSFTVHANSRNYSYDPADEMMLILAGAQLFSFIAHGIRAYGTMKTFDQRNKYLPQALITAMGFDYDDLRNNLSQMWFDLNELVARSAQIWIPNELPVIERWFWLNSNLYMDGDSVKSQYYIMVPRVVYQYNETLDETGGGLSLTTWSPYTANTWAQYMEIVNGMFKALLDSQDRGMIFGDILKAYGQDKIYALNEIPSDYQVLPVYDREVLTQIENSTSINMLPGAISQDAQGNIKQESATARLTAPSLPTMTAGNFGLQRTILNFHFKDVPTPEQIMVATRLTAQNTNTIVNAGKITGFLPGYAGTEWVTGYRIYYFNSEGLQYQMFQTCNANSMTADVMRRVQAFDWSPWLYSADGTPLITAATYPFPAGKTVTLTPQNAAGDFDNYTIIDWQTLKKMHDTAVYSEFGVPVL